MSSVSLDDKRVFAVSESSGAVALKVALLCRQQRAQYNSREGLHGFCTRLVTEEEVVPYGHVRVVASVVFSRRSGASITVPKVTV